MVKGFEYFTTHNGVRLLRIPAFERYDKVTAIFSTRLGGVSKEPFNTLNLGYHVNDDVHNVVENRRIVCKAMGWQLKDTVAGEQVHSDNIAVISDLNKGRGAIDYESSIAQTDAFITNHSGVVLSSFYADCVPIYFFDPINRAVGLAHAGWKGTLLSIGPKTLAKMTEIYGTRPEECLAAIGPSIGPCCYEVDSKLLKRFQECYDWHHKVFYAKDDGKWNLNLWEANQLQMLAAGIKQENLIISRICTSCNVDIFFSHRQERGQTGRMGAFISLE